MNLFDQVCSIEFAKKLKTLGLNHVTLFYHIARKDELLEQGLRDYGVVFVDWFNELDKSDSLDNYDYYPAYTATELGQLLPSVLEIKDTDGEWCNLMMCKDLVNHNWVVMYPCIVDQTCDKLVDAMAKVLIHLIENKLVSYGCQ